jgi:hypothetical protein
MQYPAQSIILTLYQTDKILKDGYTINVIPAFEFINIERVKLAGFKACGYSMKKPEKTKI